MIQPIDRITLTGFKSIRALDGLELRPFNVLIGANGAGKNNFVSFFTFLRELVEGRLERNVIQAGGADLPLFLGPEITKKIGAKLDFGVNAYDFTLGPTADNRLIFAKERIRDESGISCNEDVDLQLESEHNETKLKRQTEGR